jgi:hypothetical protein
MNDNYSVLSGATIYAGMVAPAQYPAWRDGLDLYEVVAIPQVATLASIDPASNVLINPNFPNAAPWRGNTGQSSVVNAYCGAAWDDSTGEYWLPLGGGHQDYAGNEPYKTNLLADTIQWQMVRWPSGAIGNPINFNDGLDATGKYSDGRLRGIHSYSYHVAHGGKVYVGCLTTPYPNVGLARQAYEIDRVTGEATLLCDYSTSGNNITGYGGAALDHTRGKLFLSGQETTRLVEIDVNAKTFVNIGSLDNIFGGYSCGVYAEEADRIVFACRQRAETAYKAHRGLAVINPATRAVTYPACENFPSFIGGAIGAAWIGSKLLLWDNSTDTNKFAVLTPSNAADLSQPWTVSEITGTGAAITARSGSGTYNRLQYSKRLGGVMLLNDVAQQMFFMRTN